MLPIWSTSFNPSGSVPPGGLHRFLQVVLVERPGGGKGLDYLEAGKPTRRLVPPGVPPQPGGPLRPEVLDYIEERLILILLRY